MLCPWVFNYKFSRNAHHNVFIKNSLCDYSKLLNPHYHRDETPSFTVAVAAAVVVALQYKKLSYTYIILIAVLLIQCYTYVSFSSLNQLDFCQWHPNWERGRKHNLFFLANTVDQRLRWWQLNWTVIWSLCSRSLMTTCYVGPTAPWQAN